MMATMRTKFTLVHTRWSASGQNLERSRVVRAPGRLEAEVDESFSRVADSLEVESEEAFAVEERQGTVAALGGQWLADANGHAIDRTDATTHDAAGARRELAFESLELRRVAYVEGLQSEVGADGFGGVVDDGPHRLVGDVGHVGNARGVATSEHPKRHGETPGRSGRRPARDTGHLFVDADVVSDFVENRGEEVFVDTKATAKFAVVEGIAEVFERHSRPMPICFLLPPCVSSEQH